MTTQMKARILSEHTIATVKATAPVLEQEGETLTRHFYQRMFTHNPEVTPFFNPANQQAGLQQKALAGAICAYAANIDNLEVLGNAVELIAQKHVSLQIQAQHYPIVGRHLLASISEILGEGATGEVLDAWAEAYGYLAHILVGREAQIYSEHAQAAGGWVGFRALNVVRKVEESEAITSFYLAPEVGQRLPDFKPGQYITVRVPTANGNTTMRNYSLSDKPGQPWYRISVKRETGTSAGTPDGYVSTFLHSTVSVGDNLEIAPPCGEFFLDVRTPPQRPLVLLSAGVGITPIMSMLASALETDPQRQIVFVHGCLNESSQAFKEAVDDLAARHPNLTTHYRYSDPNAQGAMLRSGASGGLIDVDLIESLLPERDGDFYFCGPQPFMAGIYHGLRAWGVPPAQVHFEFFGPKQALQ
ncbi:MAG: NO-inducible flavohemoprotein [Ketobacter sp.]